MLLSEDQQAVDLAIAIISAKTNDTRRTCLICRRLVEKSDWTFIYTIDHISRIPALKTMVEFADEFTLNHILEEIRKK